MKIQHIVSFLLIAMAVACRNGKQTETYPLFPEEPSRTAYEGFTWEKVSGAGIQLWAQRNPNIHIVLDDNSQSAFVERGGEQPSRWMVIKVFTLKDKNTSSPQATMQKRYRTSLHRNQSPQHVTAGVWGTAGSGISKSTITIPTKQYSSKSVKMPLFSTSRASS